MFKTLLTAIAISTFFLVLSPPGAYVVSANLPVCTPSNERKIALRAINKEGGPVDLRAEDLSLVQGKTPSDIFKLESAKDQPLSLVMLIDSSASQARSLSVTKLPASEFLKSVLGADKNRAAILSFTSEATPEQDLTHDVTKLQAAVDRIKFVPPPGYIGGGVVVGPLPPTQKSLGATALWDAIWTAVDGFPKDGSRRVILVLSDGEDTNSHKKMREAIEHAALKEVAVFAIGIADEEYHSLNRDGLQKLAQETGGIAFFPAKLSELEANFFKTAQALQSQYALTYCSANPSSPGKPTKIQIVVKNPALLQSNVRLSYPRYVF